MRTSIAERALGLVVTALLLVGPAACRDETPPGPAPIAGAGGSTGGRGGSAGRGGAGGTSGRGGATATGGSAGTTGGTGGGADAADAPASDGGSADAGDVAPSEGGTDVVIDAPAGDGGSAVMRSFYTHPTYPAGVIRPNKPQPMLDGAVTGIYTGWKKFVINGCGGSYVKAGADIGANLATVSELQGMGMVITVILAGHDENARTIFDGMFRVARAYKSNNNMALSSKEVRLSGSNCMNAAMPESQTDGDLDMATALLMAEKQWGNGGTVNYGMEARNMIAAIKMNDLNATSKLPLLGDWVSVNDAKFYWGARSADFIPGHLRAFGGATNDTFWMQSVDAIYGLVAKIQMVNSPTTGLLPDFMMNLNTNGVPASANWSGAGNPNDGQYFYHAARSPLRLVADYISSGGSEARSKTALAKMNTWIRMKTMDNPAMIIDGYNITTGATIGNGPTVVFEGPFGAAAVVDAANQAWLDAIWNRISAGAVGNDSLAESIRLMSLLIMSGHWWGP
jgi:endo-1,4-beta-D-glucanase Y